MATDNLRARISPGIYDGWDIAIYDGQNAVRNMVGGTMRGHEHTKDLARQSASLILATIRRRRRVASLPWFEVTE